MTIEEKILSILRDNITFSGQIGDYVVHGAVEKIKDLVKDHAHKAFDAGKMRGMSFCEIDDNGCFIEDENAPDKEAYLNTTFPNTVK